jgi:hypothetical protein
MSKLHTMIGIVACAAAGAAQAAGATREDQILIMGNPASAQTWRPATPRAEFSFNDRGRGYHIIATWKRDAAGVPTEYQGQGNDYMKAPVTESFRVSAGRASWHNRAEQGDKAVSGEAFYVPINAPPEFFGVLARGALNVPHPP